MTHSKQYDRLQRIAVDAYDRHQIGLSVGDALEAASSGERLEPVERALIESSVLAQICRDAQDNTDALFLAVPRIEHAREQGAWILPILDRARKADLYVAEAAILAAAAYHDPLWDLIDTIAEGGKRSSIGPIDRNAPELADQQSRLARMIANAPLDDRLVALVHARSGELSSTEIETLAAATLCVEIRTALAQVRMVVSMTRIGDLQ